jgi:hypothetical protein
MALSADRKAPMRGDDAINTREHLPVAAATIIYNGGMVAVNLSGYAVPASADPTLVVIGVAQATVDNSAGSAGALSVPVRRGVFGMVNGGTTDALSAADVGRPCYASDDQTVNRTRAGARPLAGIVHSIENSVVYVRMGSTHDAANEDILTLAAADLRLLQNTFVAMDTNAKAAAASAAGQDCIGVLLNAPNTGEIAIVRRRGYAKVTASASINPGVPLATTAAGLSKSAVTGRTDTSDAGAANDPALGSFVLGRAETAGTNGALHTIYVERLGEIPQTAQ